MDRRNGIPELSCIYYRSLIYDCPTRKSKDPNGFPANITQTFSGMKNGHFLVDFVYSKPA